MKIDKFCPFVNWLCRGTNMGPLYDPNLADPNFELGGFITLSSATPLYKAGELEAESLFNSLTNVKEYTENIREFLGLDDDVDLQCLDNYEIDLINDNEVLSTPPPVAYPLYLMTVSGKNTHERVEYIGKTSSAKSRFKGGHAAITKLHAPEYDGFEKKIYLASVLFILNNRDLLPIEWINPTNKAENLLMQIEEQLITCLKPALNTNGKKFDMMSDKYIHLIFQNRYDSMFLHEYIC